MKGLTLDISTHVGWAIGSPDVKPMFDTYRLPQSFGDDYGKRYDALDLWLDDMISVHRPDFVGFEEPVPPRGVNIETTWSTIRLLIGLVAVAETVAHRHRLRVIEAAVPTIKKHFTGSGRAEKVEMKAKCFRLGLFVGDDHQADAIGLLSYLLHWMKLPPAWDALAIAPMPQIRRPAR